MIILRLFSRLFLTLEQSARTVFVSRCFGFVFRSRGCFECDIIFVGKRERVLQIEVTFFEFVFGKIMFWISLSLVGVLFNCYDNVGHYYDALVCIFSTY